MGNLIGYGMMTFVIAFCALASYGFLKHSWSKRDNV